MTLSWKKLAIFSGTSGIYDKPFTQYPDILDFRLSDQWDMWCLTTRFGISMPDRHESAVEPEI